ncbi:hypothetical protein DND132_1741 [Pseudodesulfovibrio mercurii]|uniref:Lipoprotein n=1 Tax=Pseudodesulfovibrio mercurii TaxID=641491 RepID=F0JFV1_9BACT|nr:YbaY family lipoprotein [Pseudodesulfovibrio mercurii]EGB14947.1 hypothetical protein DND132_1741 [Pseudodesulfovibrio mercurii]
MARPLALIGAVLLLAALLPAACSPARRAAPSASTVTPLTDLRAEVAYAERMPLPPGCTLFLTLENISSLNRAEGTVATAFIPVKAAPPFTARVRFDPRRIDSRLTYSLNARIELKGQVLFTGAARVNPLAQGDDPVSIQVRMVRR